MALPISERDSSSTSSSLVGNHDPSLSTQSSASDKTAATKTIPAGGIVGIVLGFVALLVIVMLVVRYFKPGTFSRKPKWGRQHGQVVSYANAWPGTDGDKKGNRDERLARGVKMEKIDTDSSVGSEGSNGEGLKFDGKIKPKVIMLEKSLPGSPVGVAH